MTDDLVAFLRARLDEDERDARVMAEHYPPTWELSDRGWMAHVVADGPVFREVVRLEQWTGMPVGENAPYLGEMIAHVARHDPARVMREVEAKRQITFLAVRLPELTSKHNPFDNDKDAWADVLRLLALPYSDHPDYRDEWKP